MRPGCNAQTHATQRCPASPRVGPIGMESGQCSCAGEPAGCGGTCAFAIDRVELLRRARKVYTGARDEVPRARDRKALLDRARQRLAEVQSVQLNSIDPRNDVPEPSKVYVAETLRDTLDEDIEHVRKQIERILACSEPSCSHMGEEGRISHIAISSTGSTMLAVLESEVEAVEATLQMNPFQRWDGLT